ncbi:GPW/gp25 family protein [Streptomyces sp. NPDC004111]|uniref:GPW/gp25 family protein n=1 Tax=Streptomyces sp. NPDC004111 TaxID=3364690 RepID=UPI0036B6DC4C
MGPVENPGFLGRGFGFPLAVGAGDGDGDDLVMAEAEEDVRQAIELIIGTEPGERVMRPDFGSGLRGLLFAPVNTATLAVVRHRVEEALAAWEPRIDVVRVTVTGGTPDVPHGTVLIGVDYRVRATNTFYNLVLPYSLREATP